MKRLFKMLTNRWRIAVWATSLVCAAAITAASLEAQSLSFAGVQTTLGSGFTSPTDVAVDQSGNVFVADYGNNAVKEIVAVNGRIPTNPTIRTLGSGFEYPPGVAVDRNGNVYVRRSVEQFGEGDRGGQRQHSYQQPHHLVTRQRI